MTPRATTAAKTAAPLPLLTKKAMLEAEDLEELRVDIPEWNGSIVLRQLRRSEQVDAEDSATVGDEIVTNLLQLHTLAHAFVEPNYDASDIMALGEKNATIVGRIVTYQMVLQSGGKKSLEDFIKSNK